MAEHDAAATVAAGGIAPLGALLPADERTSQVVARAYRHPALEEGKVVIRLEPEAVAAGADAEMAVLGFEPPEVSVALGQQRHRTLGFPAWALVHRPKKAQAALAVTEELRKAKRLVAARPGQAREAFEKIAQRLQRAAPEFLPSFWEEVGRVVADRASLAMAAQCFERARQAERAFKLAVDPAVADAACVEFALLGAISAKSLSAYARELGGGAEGYRRFRAIVVKRALGGVPPYAAMGKDLRALCKAGKLDVEAEEEALVAELLDAPAIHQASGEFWSSYTPALLRLAERDPAVRARLRALWPEPRGAEGPEFAERWLELLAAAGALAEIPDADVGAFVSRLVRYAGNSSRVVEVLRAEADRLARLGQPIAVVGPDDLDLDLAELALELGVSLADPGDERFDVDSMSCDPVRVAAHPAYGPKLVAVVGRLMGGDDEQRIHGKAGFDVARRAWLEEQLVCLEGRPLLTIEGVLGELQSKTSADTFLPFADLHERLLRVDLAPALASQLRAGIADELGWPAYEEAAAALGTPAQVGGAFPILTAWNAQRALALDAHGVIAEHDIVYSPKTHGIEHVWHLDGQFLVELQSKDYETERYWSARPKERFGARERLSMWGGEVPTQWSPEGGGVTLGGRLFRAGAGEISSSCSFLCDGRAMWIGEREALARYDPVTGTRTRGAPAFVADHRRPGWGVRATLTPAPAGLASSPLGLRDGLLGLRRRRKDDDWDAPFEHERIDGARWDGDSHAAALVDLPGCDGPLPIDAAEEPSSRFLGGEGPCVELTSRTGERLAVLNRHDWAARGWGEVLLPPLSFWHYLTPRDPAGSRALRALGLDAARTILEAALRDEHDIETAIAAALPEVTDARLRRGVAGIAARAAELTREARELARERAKDHALPGGQPLHGEAAQLRKLAVALTAGRPAKLADFALDPRDWLTHGRALAALAMSDPDERRKARDMVRALSGTALAAERRRLRCFAIEAPDDYHDPNEWDCLVITPHDGSVFALHTSGDWGLELSTDGKFRPPPIFSIWGERELPHGIGDAWAEAFITLPDQDVPWDPEIATRLAEASGLSRAEAVLLWLHPARWTKGWRKDFLGKEQRARFALKVAEADAARSTLSEVGLAALLEVHAQAAPDDPRSLAAPLAPGGHVSRLGAAWRARFGRRVAIPQELVAAAKKELGDQVDLGKLLGALAGGAADFLGPDLRPLAELDSWGDDHGLTTSSARGCLTLIAWLFLAQPVGCAIRGGIPAVVERLRATAADERLVWPFASLYTDDDARQRAILAAVAGDSCALAVADDDGVHAGFRPAQLRGKAKKKVEQLGKLMEDPDHGEDPLLPLRTVELIVSDELQALAERVARTPVAEGGFEANPLASAPKLCAKVAKARGVGEESAALYLQILALAEPTDARVRRFNGWTAKDHARAAAELVKKKLVVEGKRERAGRSIFLRGAYARGKGKNLPLEEWKQPFYGALERQLSIEPAHLLFARAWRRVESGDVP